MVTKRPVLRRLYIKEHMEVVGLSVTDLANRMGVERQSVYRWFNGSRDLNLGKIDKIAEILGRTAEELRHPPGEAARPLFNEQMRKEVRQAVADMLEDGISARRKPKADAP